MRIDLNGIWNLHWFDGQRGDSLQRLLAPDPQTRPPLAASVPGSVHEALITAKLIDEPTLGSNSLRCRWIEDSFWFYRRTFNATKPAAGQRAWLTFECLDLAAVIYLNGKEIGRHHNYFYPCRLDVSDYLSDGENTLVVQLDGGLIFAAHRDGSKSTCTYDGELTKRVWLRKPQFVFGWDWSTRLITVGIPGAVHLDFTPVVSVEQVSAFTELAADLQQGKIRVRAWANVPMSEKITYHGMDTLRNPAPAVNADLTLTLSIPELSLHAETTRTLAGPDKPVELELAVSHPELWWPVGHGAQKLYHTEITVSGPGGILYQGSKQLGFRHVNINQNPHPQQGAWFIVEINRKPVFIKGANFVPSDMILSRITPERTRKLVDLALEQNYNCLRVWGGGLYESDEFYEACDRQGILVWQEFIFACAKYPAHDDVFFKDIQREARHQVRRLAEHASLFIWCGNNEIETAYYDWHGAFKSAPQHTDLGWYHFVLNNLMQQEDPSRYYHPSSPYSAPGIAPNDYHYGDQHPWAIGFGNTDFRGYREMTCRFPNEGGFLGPVSLPTMRACFDDVHDQRIGSLAWEHHDNAVSSWFAKNPANATLEEWLGLSAANLSLADYAYWGGLLQGEALREYIKNFRRRKFDSAAAVFWMYNDCWPTTRSWTTVDYYLRRTPSFHPVRRAFAPVIPVVVSEGDKFAVYGVNEGGEWHGKLRFGTCSLLAGNYPFDKSMDVALAANASTLLAEFSIADWDPNNQLAFAVLSRDGEIVGQDRLFLPYFKEIAWPKNPAICIELANGKARFSSDQFVWNICLDLDGGKNFPDNFFDLLPGIPREFPWPAELGEPKILRIGNSLISQ